MELLRQTASVTFTFSVAGPPNIYTIFGSVDLVVWTELGVITNQFGFARFGDPDPPPSPQKFYRARLSN